MESAEGIAVFQQISVSPEAREMVMLVLQGSSARNLPATAPEEAGELDMDALMQFESKGP